MTTAADAKLTDRSADFFDFGGVHYINCAYKGPMPKAAVAALDAALELEKTPHLLKDEYFFTYPDAYRSGVAELIGCATADVAVTDSTTHGMMILVNGLDWRAGDEVVVPKGEFPANRFPWLSLEARGVTLKEVEIAPGGRGVSSASPTSPTSPEAAIEAAITPRTRVVSASWVGYDGGLRLDLARLGRICREAGVLFAVDGSQGLGGLAFDLAETPCDLLACSGYKWLLGPYGLGFAYVRPDLAERLDVGNVNWFSLVGARDFNQLSRARLEFEPGAWKFDINETASFVKLAAGTASLAYLREVTPAAVEAHVRALQDRLIGALPGSVRPVGDMASQRRSNLLFLAGDSEDATVGLYRSLVDNGFVVSLREGSIRLSPHIYNTARELDELAEIVNRLSG